jgi:hypothetical protein
VMQPIRQSADPLEGLSLEMDDLHAARAWASAHPELRLVVATGYLLSPEVIEVYPPGSTSPRWFVWRDHVGRVRGGDCQAYEFAVLYPSVRTALRFIARAAASPLAPSCRNDRGPAPG